MASPFIIRQAAHLIRHSGIIAYPTESVYGLGCNPYDDRAVFHLLQLKQRPLEKGLILLATDLCQLSTLIDPLSEAQKLTIDSESQPATWVVPASRAPYWLRGQHQSLAIRLTQHPVAAALCNRFGQPIVSTSANLSGKTPATTALKARQYFNNTLDLIIHGETGPLDRPSTIKDLNSGKIFRQ